MSFVDSIKSCISKYATFKGRAPRSEYWWFILFGILVYITSGIIFSAIGFILGGVEGATVAWFIGYLLCGLMLFLPMLSVMVRRLHDTNHSGWWFFISWIPLIGGIWLLILMLTDSDEENEYGLPIY